MSPVGTSVIQVTATDADDPTYGNSARVVYSILQGQPYFSVEPKTGIIRTALPSMDREAKDQYLLVIQAKDMVGQMGGLSGTTSVTVTLTDVNDNPPRFARKDPTQVGRGIAVISVLDINDNAPVFAMEYETFLCENAQPGQVIQTISAVDKDEPPNGHRFYFALTPEAASNLNFTLRDNKDNTASILTKRNGFRRQDQSIYKLPIFIMDSGSPSLSSTNTLTIRVCDCDPDGTAQSCNAETYVLPAGLSTGALIAILACVLTLLVLVLLIVTMRRRKKEPLIFDEEQDIRENIVRYDDEGGGEEDTEAFDMAALRNLNVIRDTKTRRDVTPEIQFFSRPSYKSIPDNVIFREFIWDRLKEADIDPSAPPYDSLQTYAFEGSGSVAESLSSLESLSTDSDQNYDYLSDWGPRFKKLADMYGNSEDSVFS
ncbi:UNVERIFIED_CONTAM: hypothetical protein FKN15_050596 [Acipenser sinensis]